MTVHGPYETASQVTAETAHVYRASRDHGRAGLMTLINEGLLLAALRQAGVETGAEDLRIIGWLADWEPETVQVVIGIIERAGGKPRAALTSIIDKIRTDWDEHPDPDLGYLVEAIEAIAKEALS